MTKFNIDYSEIAIMYGLDLSEQVPARIDIAISIEESILDNHDVVTAMFMVQQLFAQYGVNLNVIDKLTEVINIDFTKLSDQRSLQELQTLWKNTSDLSKKLRSESTGRFNGILLYLTSMPYGLNGGHRAGGIHYEFSGGYSEDLINVWSVGHSPVGLNLSSHRAFYMLVSLISHELGHALGAAHDYSKYEGDMPSIMYPIIERVVDPREVFFSTMSSNEMIARINVEDYFHSKFGATMTVNGERTLFLEDGRTYDYKFSVDKGQLKDVLVVSQPWSSSGDRSLTEYMTNHDIDFEFLNNELIIRNHTQNTRGHIGNYVYSGVIHDPETGEDMATRPVVLHVE